MRRQGFTLIEVMIAMMIFAIITTLTFQGLQTSLDVQQKVEERAAVFKDMQLLVTLMHEDFTNVIRRSVRPSFGTDQLASFVVGDITEQGREASYECVVQFTRTGLPQGTGALRAGMVRVAYCFDGDNNLYRLLWPILDRSQDSLPVESLLIEGVSEFAMEIGEEDLEEWEEYDCGYDSSQTDKCLDWLPGGSIKMTLGLDTESGLVSFNRSFPIGSGEGIQLWKLKE